MSDPTRLLTDWETWRIDTLCPGSVARPPLPVLNECEEHPRLDYPLGVGHAACAHYGSEHVCWFDEGSNTRFPQNRYHVCSHFRISVYPTWQEAREAFDRAVTEMLAMVNPNASTD